MCVGDDGYEKLEFEMTVHVVDRTRTDHFHPNMLM